MDPLVWSILLIVAGITVVGIELFVPSAGMLGVIAAVLILAGIVAAFISNWIAGTVVLLLTSFSLPLILMLFLKVWPHTPIGKRVLIGAMTESDVLPPDDMQKKLHALIGRRGTAKTKMLPSGIILVDGHSYDAVSDGFAVEPGDPVEVLAVRNKRIIVRLVSADEVDQTLPPPTDDVLSQPIDQLGIDPIDPLDADSKN